METSALSKVVIGTSIGVITFGFAFFYSLYQEKAFFQNLREIRKKIKKNWKNNPNIEKLNIKCENIIPLKGYQDIQFYVKVIASEKFAKAKPSDNRIPIGYKFDPFAPEHRGKIFIDDLSETHALLYNKFPLVPFHVLIVTKEFEPQCSLVGKRDFEAALKVMKALDSFIFFNGGPNAGASQEHKHLQAIPYSSFPYQTLPLDALLKDGEEEANYDEDGLRYFTLPLFQFKHIFCLFKPNITTGLNYDNIKQRSELLALVYKECLRRLKNDDLHHHYNFILTRRWIFVVLRKCEVALGMIKINAVGFTGSFAVRSDQEYEFLQSNDPIKILHSVSFPIEGSSE